MTQVVCLAKGSYAIYVESASVEEILVNKLIKIEKQIAPSSQATRSVGTILVDTKKIEHVFNITGFISARIGSGNNVVDSERTTSGVGFTKGDAGYSTSKAVKLSLIKNILYNGGNIELYYRDLVDSDYATTYADNQSTSGVNHIKTNLDKLSIKEVSNIGDTSTSPASYSIQLNLTRGKIKGV